MPRDSDGPAREAPDDSLHPKDAGYEAMADAIDLGLSNSGSEAGASFSYFALVPEKAVAKPRAINALPEIPF